VGSAAGSNTGSTTGIQGRGAVFNAAVETC